MHCNIIQRGKEQKFKSTAKSFIMWLAISNKVGTIGVFFIIKGNSYPAFPLQRTQREDFCYSEQ